MENNMEQQNSLETKPSFLQEFMVRVEEKVKEMLLNPEIETHFVDSGGHSRHVREGHPCDVSSRDIELKVRAAKILQEETQKDFHGTREDFHKQESIAKLVAFLEKEEAALRILFDVNDDERYQDVALVVNSEMKNSHAKYVSTLV